MRHRSLSTALALLALPSLAVAAPETPSQRADKLFEQSKPLLAAGRYSEACPLLAESQSLDPATGTLLALALCHEAEGKTATAFAELKEVAIEAQKEGRSDRTKLANAHVHRLEPQLSWIVLAVPDDAKNVQDFAVEEDGRPVPSAEWNQKVPADPGEHVLGASAPGRVPWRMTLVLPKEETKTVTVPVLEEEHHETPVAALPAPPAESSSRRRAGFITMGAGGAAFAVGVGFGIAALAEQGSVKDLCPNLKCPAGAAGAEGSAKSSTVQAYAWGADVALGIGIAAAAAGLYLVLSHGSSGGATSAVVVPTPGGASAVLSRAW